MQMRFEMWLSEIDISFNVKQFIMQKYITHPKIIWFTASPVLEVLDEPYCMRQVIFKKHLSSESNSCYRLFFLPKYRPSWPAWLRRRSYDKWIKGMKRKQAHRCDEKRDSIFLHTRSHFLFGVFCEMSIVDYNRNIAAIFLLILLPALDISPLSKSVIFSSLFLYLFTLLYLKN